MTSSVLVRTLCHNIGGAALCSLKQGCSFSSPQILADVHASLVAGTKNEVGDAWMKLKR